MKALALFLKAIKDSFLRKFQKPRTRRIKEKQAQSKPQIDRKNIIPVEIADYLLEPNSHKKSLATKKPLYIDVTNNEFEQTSFIAPSKNQNSGLPDVPISSAIQEFSLVQLSPHSQRAYAKDLKDFFSFLRVQNIWNDWNSSLTPLLVAEYREHLYSERGLAKSTVTRKLAVLKSFCKWAISRGWIDRNPAELVRSFPQTQESKTGFLSDHEIRKLLRSLPTDLESPRLFRALTRVTIETLLMLGLRRSEASAIHLNDIEYTDETWLLRVHGKGSRDRLLPIPPRLLATWSEWLERVVPDTAPFTNMEDNPTVCIKFFKAHRDIPLLISTRAKDFDTPISPGEIGHIVRKAGFFAQLPKRLSPHMLRATAITHALDQGASHRGIQQMAGWTSPLMITRYDKRKNDPKFSAIHQLLYSKNWDFLDDISSEHDGDHIKLASKE